jgi:hypothetical protein
VGNGLLIHVPENCNLLWARTPNNLLEQYVIAHVSASDHLTEGEFYAGGLRHLVEIAPDGGA